MEFQKMNTMKRMTILLVAVSFASSLKAQLTVTEFEAVLKQAQRQVSATNYEMTTFTSFKPIKYSRKTGDRTWEVGLNSWGPNNTTSTQDLLSTVAIITLTDDGYTFISATQPVSSDLLSKVQDYKYVKVGQKWLSKQMNYATIQYDWVEGKHVTSASSPVDGKTKKITDDLMNLLNVSRGMQNTVALAVNKYQ